MSYDRTGVLTGQVIDLRVVVTDATSTPVNTDALPDVYIYDSSVDIETIEAEILAATFTSAIAGPLVPTNISTGLYELEYTVPNGVDPGTWRDVWIGQIDGVDVPQILDFEVKAGGDIVAQVLLNNELIIIELDESITNLAGDLSLGRDTLVSWSTIYKPLYASPDLVRLEVGPVLNVVPDDTLALMIHCSSLLADFIAIPPGCDKKRLAFARTRFVIFDSALRALLQPGIAERAGLGSASSGDKKSLADLSIVKGNGGSTVATASSGIDIDTLAYLREQRDEWFRVVNAGGCINPGQGLDPTSAIKGRFDPDRRASGRLWLNPEFYDYPQPSTNVKVHRPGTQRGRFGFSDLRRLRRSFIKKRY